MHATPEELADVKALEEDVPLFQDGKLTEAGELCLTDIRRLS
jgi:hypothetical protein